MLTSWFQICGESFVSSTVQCNSDSTALFLTAHSVVIPSLLLATLNAKNLWDEHWEHVSHMPPLEERPQYSYMNIRTKAFPFGDGDKVSDIHGNLILTLNSRSVANVLTLKTLL